MRRDYLRLSAGGALAKLIGGAREILLARFFGTGPVADAYRGSLTLTLSPVHLLTAKAIETCFVPLYARHRSRDPRRAQALLQTLLLIFVGLGVLVAAALLLGAAPLVGVVLQGFDPQRAELAVRMLRVLALGVPAYVYCGILSSLGMAQRDFAIPALRPGLQNLGMVVMIALAAWREDAVLAAWGFSATYALLALWASARLRRRGLLRLQRAWDGRLARETGGELWRALRPLVMLSVLIEANILIERHVATRIGPGSVAALDYARFLTESVHFLVAVPLGLLGLSLFANLSAGETRERTARLLALLFVVLLPASAFLLMNGRPILTLLYLRGRYDAESLRVTAGILAGLSAGLWAYSASHVLQRILNARLQNRVVLLGEGLAVALNVGCNLLLYRSLGPSALGVGAAAGALASFLFYLRSMGHLGGVFYRTAGHMIAAVPPYLLLAWGLGRSVSAGLSALALQSLLGLAYWSGAIALRRETRRLIAGGIGAGGRG